MYGIFNYYKTDAITGSSSVKYFRTKTGYTFSMNEYPNPIGVRFDESFSRLNDVSICIGISDDDRYYWRIFSSIPDKYVVVYYI